MSINRYEFKMHTILPMLIFLAQQTVFAYNLTGQEEKDLENITATSDLPQTNSLRFPEAHNSFDIISRAISQFESTNKNRPANGSEDHQIISKQERSELPTQIGQRKLIKSRYRLRSNGDAVYGRQLASYSQPFDTKAIPLPASYRDHDEQHVLARALMTGTPTGIDSPMSYAYLAAPSQRAPTQSAGGDGESGGSSGLQVEEPTSYNQDSLVDYAPPSMPSYNQASLAAPAAPAAIPSRLRGAQAASASEFNLPYFMASPSIGYGDYYGSGSLVNHAGHYGANPLLNNLSEHLSYSATHLPSEFSSSHYNPTTHSRWSWPWTDMSNLGHSALTAATFKKHHHHHHHHLAAQHKQHDYHHHLEDHDHLMSKLEHGISIGEIACIAIAVVLGVVILGSPFFLLFLMLFNGGNLFGTTQMGLLAPATVQAGAPAAAGRRRKRSVEGIASGKDHSSKGERTKLNELGELGQTGEYLFEHLSPFLDPDKLLRSFGRMMDVKDDIEKIVAKLVEKVEDQNRVSTASDSEHRHVEMRRRRK